MFAIMFGCIIAPLVLTRVLKYYNKLSAGYLKGKHRIERIGNTDDGYRPLFLAIQSRTPVHWNLHESFQNVLEEMGLVIIDHRSWHTLDRTEQSAVDITELFVQDTKMKVRIKHCFGKSADSDRLENGMSVRSVQSDGVADELKTETSSIEGLGEERDIEERCVQIKEGKHDVAKIFAVSYFCLVTHPGCICREQLCPKFSKNTVPTTTQFKSLNGWRLLSTVQVSTQRETYQIAIDFTPFKSITISTESQRRRTQVILQLMRKIFN
jgi:hypothetical protein